MNHVTGTLLREKSVKKELDADQMGRWTEIQTQRQEDRHAD